MKIIAVHLERCTGCKTCELYCAAERGSTSTTRFQAVQEDITPQTRVRVEGSSQGSVPIQCRQCQQAPCIDSCLTGALGRDPQSNIVLIDENACIGCWTCTLFCPYGVIYPSPERKIAIKCDRCLFMEIPVCVDVCPTKAIELIDMDDYQHILRSRRTKVYSELHDSGIKEGTLLLEVINTSGS